MDFVEIIREFGFLGAAVIGLAYTIYWLVKWIRELTEARQKDAERFGDRAVERERAMVEAMNELASAVREWNRDETSQ